MWVSVSFQDVEGVRGIIPGYLLLQIGYLAEIGEVLGIGFWCLRRRCRFPLPGTLVPTLSGLERIAYPAEPVRHFRLYGEIFQQLVLYLSSREPGVAIFGGKRGRLYQCTSPTPRQKLSHSSRFWKPTFDVLVEFFRFNVVVRHRYKYVNDYIALTAGRLPFDFPLSIKELALRPLLPRLLLL